MAVELDQFSELVAGIYDAALDNSRWDETLRRMVAAFGGSGGALLMAGGPRRLAYTSVRPDDAAIKAYNAYYGRMDPAAAALERNQAGTILCVSEVIPSARRRRSEFYNDWACRMVDASDGVFATLYRSEGGVGWANIWSPLRPGSFANAGRVRLMRLLVPHLRQAMHMQSSLAGMDVQKRGALDVLDRLTHGIVLLASDGTVLFANRAAARLSAANDGVTVGRAGIRAAFQDETAALRRLIGISAGRQGARAGGTMTLMRPSTGRPLVLHAMPVGEGLNDLSSVDVLVVIVDPDDRLASLPDALRRLYGLTAAEAAVAAEVVQGEGLRAVAEKMAVSLSTVRIHLQRVFEKTRTHRQAELTRLLLTLDAGIAEMTTLSKARRIDATQPEINTGRPARR